MAARGEERGMRPALDYAPLVEHEDQVRAADRAQAVRDDEARALPQKCRKRVLDTRLRECVYRARRLVEDDYPRVREERAHEARELALADRDSRPAPAALGRRALRQLLDHVEASEPARRIDHLGLGRVGLPQADVLEDGAA